MLINVTNLKRTLVKYLGWALLYVGKPFTSVGNWFWRKHRTVLDWNNNATKKEKS
jgi:hypothetical protein